MMSASTHMRCSGVSPRSHERIGLNGSRSSCRRRVCMLSRQRNTGSAAVLSASLQPAVAAKTMIGGRMNVRGVTATYNKNAKSVAGGRGRLQVVAARVAGVEIPSKKRLETSLTYIYGIGPTTAKQILGDTGIENKRVFELDDKELATIRSEVEKYTVEGDLRRQVELNIKRLIDIQCYRGRRHQMRLPVRGQRTKTNARTRKGKSSPVAGKKK